MEIKETITRDCCTSADMKPYNGCTDIPEAHKIIFCKHCGQIWYEAIDEESIEITLKKAKAIARE